MHQEMKSVVNYQETSRIRFQRGPTPIDQRQVLALTQNTPSLTLLIIKNRTNTQQ